MTQKELRRLRRSDLMEMLLELSKENLQLRQELEESNRQLRDRTIRIEEAGSLAEAALLLNGVFEAAQAACQQYEENLRMRCQAPEKSKKPSGGAAKRRRKR